ncbi:MoxR family ATPase [Candidatus Gracilibacteria bacterium]|nr:MoxR family ATPase [Candidatus Gracilibacteria bacterium]
MKEKIQQIRQEIAKRVIGNDDLITDILTALLCEGHILVEGHPGLAKTLIIETLAQVVDLSFSRIQFTPDLLPSDIVGAEIYHPKNAEFLTKKGPIFNNILLADEVNRAPAKVQSALLEAMQEKQVSIGGVSHELPQPFFVLATQNPIEQDGTYTLPEAQIDRFLLKSLVYYPDKDTEKQIMQQSLAEQKPIKKILSAKDLDTMRDEISQIHISENIYDYIVHIVQATRSEKYSEYILYGASPRASVALLKTAQVQAYFAGRDFVAPEDVRAMVYGVLRHRIMPTYHALGENIDSDHLIDRILEDVPLNSSSCL